MILEVPLCLRTLLFSSSLVHISHTFLLSLLCLEFNFMENSYNIIPKGNYISTLHSYSKELQVKILNEKLRQVDVILKECPVLNVLSLYEKSLEQVIAVGRNDLYGFLFQQS